METVCCILKDVKPKLLVFLDSHERELIDISTLLKCTDDVVRTTLLVGDILFCNAYEMKCKNHGKNGK